MGAAGQAHVRRDHDQYVGKWGDILRTCVDAAPRRTRVHNVELVVNRIGWGTTGKSRRVPWLLRHRFSRNPFRGCGPLGHAALRCSDRLEAVDDETGAVVPLPITVAGPDDGVFLLGCTFDIAQVSAKPSNGPVELRLRLRFTWENSYWETDVHRGGHSGRGHELSYLDDGAVRLRAHPRTRRSLRESSEEGPADERQLTQAPEHPTGAGLLLAP